MDCLETKLGKCQIDRSKNIMEGTIGPPIFLRLESKFNQSLQGCTRVKVKKNLKILSSPLRTTGNAALTRKYGFEVTEGT